MNIKQQRVYRRAAVAAMVNLIGDDYVHGKWFHGDPPVGDCRGAVETSWERAGGLAAIGGHHDTVRNEYAWAKVNNCLLAPDAPMKKGDLLIMNDPKAAPEPGNPLCIRHVTMCEFPKSAAYPDGVAISALNPKYGVMEHDLALTYLINDDGTTQPVHFGLAILNIFRPNLDLIDVPSATAEPPISPQP